MLKGGAAETVIVLIEICFFGQVASFKSQKLAEWKQDVGFFTSTCLGLQLTEYLTSSSKSLLQQMMLSAQFNYLFYLFPPPALKKSERKVRLWLINSFS